MSDIWINTNVTIPVMATVIDLFAFLHSKKVNYLGGGDLNTPVSAPRTISQHRDTKDNVVREFVWRAWQNYTVHNKRGIGIRSRNHRTRVHNEFTRAMNHSFSKDWQVYVAWYLQCIYSTNMPADSLRESSPHMKVQSTRSVHAAYTLCLLWPIKKGHNCSTPHGTD
jgi:hypothetical protein